MDKKADITEVMQQAVIYKKETVGPLSDYQKGVNEAAREICVDNPTMLRNRGRLLEAAKQKVHEGGYAFKKGKSGSKTYGTPYSSQAKRTKMIHDVIEDRI